MLVFLLFILVCALAFVFVSAIVDGVRQGQSNTKGKSAPHFSSSSVCYSHPTKASNSPIPYDPRYFNIGSSYYHKSKECSNFSILKPWDAITESDALKKQMVACPRCKETIVFIYPRGKVYHRTKFCSDSQSLPIQVSENDAITRGLHRCSKCW